MMLRAGTWEVDRSRSSVEFAVKHLGLTTVVGRFEEFTGTLELRPGGGTASGFVEVASVSIGEPARDEFLVSPDFFDAGRFPQITFLSSELRPVDETTFAVIGGLTIHGHTRPVTLDVVVTEPESDATGPQKIRLTVSGQISRAHFQLQFAGASNKAVGDKVRLELSLVATRSS